MKRSLSVVLATVTALAGGGTAVYFAGTASAAAACVPAWSASQVYVGGNSASQNGHNYGAKWWTQNESPATHSGQWDVWADNGACGGGTPARVSCCRMPRAFPAPRGRTTAWSATAWRSTSRGSWPLAARP